ncbi:MAG: hypothetical protein Q8867_05840 [Bacteroidota bacterium]|nr:hypothetical protein [Bacteroidota bacterium]
MKESKFTESQITQLLKEHDAGKNILNICRELKPGMARRKKMKFRIPNPEKKRCYSLFVQTLTEA